MPWLQSGQKMWQGKKMGRAEPGTGLNMGDSQSICGGKKQIDENFSGSQLRMVVTQESDGHVHGVFAPPHPILEQSWIIAASSCGGPAADAIGYSQCAQTNGRPNRLARFFWCGAISG